MQQFPETMGLVSATWGSGRRENDIRSKAASAERSCSGRLNSHEKPWVPPALRLAGGAQVARHLKRRGWRTFRAFYILTTHLIGRATAAGQPQQGNRSWAQSDIPSLLWSNCMAAVSGGYPGPASVGWLVAVGCPTPCGCWSAPPSSRFSRFSRLAPRTAGGLLT